MALDLDELINLCLINLTIHTELHNDVLISHNWWTLDNILC